MATTDQSIRVRVLEWRCEALRRECVRLRTQRDLARADLEVARHDRADAVQKVRTMLRLRRLGQ